MFIPTICLAMFASAMETDISTALKDLEKHHPNLTIRLFGDERRFLNHGFKVFLESHGVFRDKFSSKYTDKDMAATLSAKKLLSPDGIMYAYVETDDISLNVLMKALTWMSKQADPKIKTVITVLFKEITIDPEGSVERPNEQRVQFELVGKSPKGRHGWPYALRDEDNNGLYDLSGKRASKKSLQKVLRAPIRKDGREESILSISMRSIDEMKMSCLAYAVKEIEELRDPKHANYVYFALRHGTDFTDAKLNKLHVELEYETPKTKNGCDVLLQSEGLFDFQGNKLSQRALHKMLHSTFRNHERDESVLYIHIHDVKKSKVIFLVNALQEIEAQRDPKIPTYVFVDLSRF